MSKIPGFKNLEEEAKFWDIHDTEEFADEFESVEVKFAYPLKHKWMLTVELDEESFNQVKKLAEGAGKEPGVLIRTWVLEHIKKEPLESPTTIP
jgi:RNA:NAD 2'-phosphotransferase (TPT1/KptA family)